MAYYKRKRTWSAPNGRYRKRRRMFKSRGGLNTKRLWSAIRSVKKKAIGEYKFADVDLTTSNMNIDSGVLLPILEGIAQGTDTINDRIGNKIVVRTINLKISLGGVAGLLSFTESLYMYMVIDRRTQDNTAPAFSDIFTAQFAQVWRNADEYKRFIVMPVKQLKGDLIANASLGDATSDAQSLNVNFYKRFKHGVTVHYTGAAGTTINRNSIYFVLFSQETTDVIDITGGVRITYTEE